MPDTTRRTLLGSLAALPIVGLPAAAAPIADVDAELLGLERQWQSSQDLDELCQEALHDAWGRYSEPEPPEALLRRPDDPLQIARWAQKSIDRFLYGYTGSIEDLRAAWLGHYDRVGDTDELIEILDERAVARRARSSTSAACWPEEQPDARR